MMPVADSPPIIVLFLCQMFLLLTVSLLQTFTSFNLLPSAGSFLFNQNTLIASIAYTTPVVIAGFIFDNLPWSISKRVKRSTRVFCLRLIGISTQPILAALLAIFVSISAGTDKNHISLATVVCTNVVACYKKLIILHRIGRRAIFPWLSIFST
jgi:hypothetical protein